jgi:dihydrofolate synthase/folylpolyglutamate synthase
MNDNLASTVRAREYCSALEELLRRPSNPKLGLDRIGALLDLIGFDRSSMRIIQVVGTNGKGSTVAFVESMLLAHGISCGLFTSPHLCTARERIRIDGELISEADFVLAASQVIVKTARLDDEASFFECMLAMAMWAMQRRGIKIAIVEAGLGGRLDATTALDADVLGITSIDLDHQNVLGATLGEIAREKIAAARKGQNVITVAQSEEALAALKNCAHHIGCTLSFAESTDLSTGLYGKHQQINAGLAIALVRALVADVTTETISRGLSSVRWPGRFEIIERSMPVILDGAHNPAGIAILAQAIKSHERLRDRPIMMIYGSLTGPNVDGKIAVLKESHLPIERIYLHEPNNARAVSASMLRTALVAGGFTDEMLAHFISMSEVLEEARLLNAAIVVCGSLYTVGEIRGELENIAMDFMAPSF